MISAFTNTLPHSTVYYFSVLSMRHAVMFENDIKWITNIRQEGDVNMQKPGIVITRCVVQFADLLMPPTHQNTLNTGRVGNARSTQIKIFCLKSAMFLLICDNKIPEGSEVPHIWKLLLNTNNSCNLSIIIIETVMKFWQSMANQVYAINRTYGGYHSPHTIKFRVVVMITNVSHSNETKWCHQITI